jgi:RNA polymerase sigma-70 factor (ECF subfamily)
MDQSEGVPPASTRAPAGDVDLVKAAQAGDREAFGVLYERYGRTIHGVLLARVPFDAVDDLVQDVFLVALERLHTLRNVSAFGGWLAAIARHRSVDYHRRAPAEVGAPEQPVPDHHAAAEALAVLAVIRTLPEAYRETLTLRLVEGMTGPEIAERTGLTPGSVRVNLHRGMKQLREKLDRRRNTT